VRYGHDSRARDLEVVCPRCGGRARAFKPSEEKGGVIVGDLSPAWNVADWRVSCVACPYRADGVAYQTLPELFWQFAVGRTHVWAWNRDHLTFLATYLDGDETAVNHPYGWLAA